MGLPVGIGGIHPQRTDVQPKLQSHVGDLIGKIAHAAREVLVDHIGPGLGPPATVELDVAIAGIVKLRFHESGRLHHVLGGNLAAIRMPRTPTRFDGTHRAALPDAFTHDAAYLV